MGLSRNFAVRGNGAMDREQTPSGKRLERAVLIPIEKNPRSKKMQKTPNMIYFDIDMMFG